MMKMALQGIVLYVLNRLLDTKFGVADVPTLKLVAREKITLSESDLESIKMLQQARLRLGEDDVNSVGLLQQAGLRLGDDGVESIRLLQQAGLRLGEGDVASINLLQQTGLQITSANVSLLKCVARGANEANTDWITALCNNHALAERLNKKTLQNLEALAMNNRLDELDDMADGIPLSYSQEGEAMILDRFLNFQQTGFFVDVGAHHPKRFSNTYSFYKRGWRGINIDPTPGAKELFDMIRPEDTTLSAAVSNEEGSHDFYLFNEPALNTFSPSLAAEYQRSGYRLLEVRSIESRRLSSLLADCHVNNAIDFMSVDVEDHELSVLQSNDWTRFRPRVLVVEILNFDLNHPERFPTHNFILALGYTLFAKTYNTLFYKDKTT